MQKKVFFFASALALMTSCAEDSSWTSESVTGSPESVMLSEGDLTFGYNSIITESDSLSCLRIPLNTTVPVTISCSKELNALKCVKIDGKYYLQVANPDQTRLGVDEVTLTIENHPELTKRFLLTVNDSETLTRAADQDSLKKRFADVFSLGQYIWLGPTEKHPSAPMLNADVLYNGLSDINDLRQIVELDPLQPVTYDYRKSEGSSKEEHANNWSINAGVDNIPIGEAAQVGISASFSKKSASKHYFEYMTESKSALLATAQLTLGMMAIPACDTLWKRLISEQLDNVLNNPGSNLYKKFEENLNGACEIIDSYGSHLLTYCALGTNATLQFRKKTDMTKTSMEWAVKVTIDQQKEDLDNDTQDAVAAAQYVNSQRNPHGSIGYEQSTEDYLEEIEMEMGYTMVGGNVTDITAFDQWKPTDNPYNWFPVQFRDNSANRAILRAIYELCQDSTSVRYKTLYKAINEYNADSINYFTAWKAAREGISLVEPETEWVLAGIYVDTDGSKGTKPAPKKMKLADGVTDCMFYPYTDLEFNAGNCLDTETGDFGECGRGGCHYWYYGMMMRDDFEGLEDIRLVDRDREKEWRYERDYVRCMNPGAKDMGEGWGCNETNNFVLMAKPIEKGNPRGVRPITGMRIEAWDKKNKTGDHLLVGVSSGTECGTNGVNAKRYRYYWTDDDAQQYISYVKDHNGNVAPVYYLSWVHQPWYPFLSVTTRPIRYYDAVLSTPSDMKDQTK